MSNDGIIQVEGTIICDLDSWKEDYNDGIREMSRETFHDSPPKGFNEAYNNSDDTMKVVERFINLHITGLKEQFPFEEYVETRKNGAIIPIPHLGGFDQNPPELPLTVQFEAVRLTDQSEPKARPFLMLQTEFENSDLSKSNHIVAEENTTFTAEIDLSGCTDSPELKEGDKITADIELYAIDSGWVDYHYFPFVTNVQKLTR